MISSKTPSEPAPQKAATPSHPNFPPCPDRNFVLEWVTSTEPRPEFPPLRTHSGSGLLLPLGALVCRDTSDASAVAGGCAVAFPRPDDTPSPRHMPHPVLGEWISALRYTGCQWIEAGVFDVRPGYSEEQVLDALWNGLERLMKRNGATFLVGAAPESSLALSRALQQGARALEPSTPGALRHFVWAV